MAASGGKLAAAGRLRRMKRKRRQSLTLKLLVFELVLIALIAAFYFGGYMIVESV